MSTAPVEEHVVPSTMQGRQLFRNVNLSDQYDGNDQREPATIHDAQVISSKLTRPGDFHAPVLDLDFHASLVPSSTEGHFHLYLDIEIPWAAYERLLRAMEECKILEPGYVAASIARGHTAVRLPWVRKDPVLAQHSGPVVDPWA